MSYKAVTDIRQNYSTWCDLHGRPRDKHKKSSSRDVSDVICLSISLTVHTYRAWGRAWPSTGETKWSTTFPTHRQNPKQLRTRVWTPLPYTSLAVSMLKTHGRLDRNWSEQHVSGRHVLSKLVWLKAHSTDYHLKCTGTKQSTHALLLISTEYDPAVFNSLGRRDWTLFSRNASRCFLDSASVSDRFRWA